MSVLLRGVGSRARPSPALLRARSVAPVRALTSLAVRRPALRTTSAAMLGSVQRLLLGRGLASSSLLQPSGAARKDSPAAATAAPSASSNSASAPSSSSSSAASGKGLGYSIAGSFREGRSIYLDMQATTPVDPRVLDAMMPFYTEQFGNAHSRTHHFGWETERAVEDAREHVAALIGALRRSPSTAPGADPTVLEADAKEIIFTSGATESNNAAIKGVARFYKAKKKHIITTQIEHKCVLDSCRVLQTEGFDVTYLPVQSNGLVDLKVLEAAIRPDTALISVMFVNNEIGVIQPIAEIGKIARKHKVFFHSDAAQALGKVPIDVDAMNVDLMSLSGHKAYGPKGIGALYVRRRPRVRLESIISGGGQERGLRSGTLPVPLIVGMGEACRIASEEMAYDYEHVTALAKRLIDGVNKRVTHVVLNGVGFPEAAGSASASAAQRLQALSDGAMKHGARYPGNLNLSFAYVEGESLLMALKEVAVSSGSACTSASLEPSYVLRALGVEEDMAHTSIRFGLGRFTTTAEVDYTVDLLTRHVTRLREMSPLWDMVQEGIDLKTIKWTTHE